jgi:hypothetical protein
VFCNNDEVWEQLQAAALAMGDPCWRLPLWPGYRKMLDSKVAGQCVSFDCERCSVSLTWQLPSAVLPEPYRHTA